MKVAIKIPSSWNELTDAQLEKIAALFHSGKKGVVFDLAVWDVLAGNNPKSNIVLQNIPMSYIDGEGKEAGLKSYFQFIYDELKRTAFPDFIQNNSGEMQFPPLPALANITAEEFAMAEDLHLDFRNTGDRRFLQALCAVLYVGTNPHRPVFSKEVIPFLGNGFSKIPTSKLLAIELAYSGCKNLLAKKYPKAYPKPVEVPGVKPKKQKGGGFAKVIRRMANGDLSKVKSIGQTNVYTFHDQFQDDIITAKENERNAKRS